MIQAAIFSIYLGAIIGILIIKLVPSLNNLLLYGKVKSLKYQRNFTEFLVRLTVPKKWFNHYYISLFCYCVLIYWIDLSKILSIDPSSPSIYKNLKIIHYCLWFQGFRRCIDCFTFTKYSNKSTINLSHYLLGMLHYFLISCHLCLCLAQVKSQEIKLTMVDLGLIALFLLASLWQSYNHYHLSTLIKYSLPKFTYVASPHYLNEIVIYFVFMIFSLKDFTSNWLIAGNFVICFVFVVTNLSISALETWKFYQLKFGDKFKVKYAIIPGIL